MADSGGDAEASRMDLDKLQGAWRTIAVEVDGAPVASWLYEATTLVITGDRFSLRNPLPDADQRREGVLRLDATRTPRELDVILEGGQTVAEIYELHGDTLRVCYPVSGNRRPTEFRTLPQSGLSLVEYKRETPGS